MTSQTALESLLARFAAAECSWISSVRPSGRVHSVPVWHVWAGGRAFIVTTDDAVKVGNIAHNPHVVVALPDPIDPLIIEGVASLEATIPPELAARFKDKYGWDPLSDPAYSVLIAVTPSKVIAWGKHGEGRWKAGDIHELQTTPEDKL